MVTENILKSFLDSIFVPDDFVALKALKLV